ncbi:hypothetical protein BJF79_17660 [Actinomadura sp. CNU-125]|uniref:hypothetical protein n=1 Tax=Actinomadura sp. CNU-125 TaxID=1904961 RepID=UPI00095B685F|nr:hypothetical protein BJF79_17660 [Actinomadura sp. CNU-125]
MRASGFSLVEVRRDERLAGFAFGFSMRRGGWWANASLPPPDVLDAPKFAVVELVVERTERGAGLGGALLDALLCERPEPIATLAAVLGADAYGWYVRRGCRKAAEFRVEPPHSDALVLDLRGAAA